jgi:uncharacterized delta-60 repeat protein
VLKRSGRYADFQAMPPRLPERCRRQLLLVLLFTFACVVASAPTSPAATSSVSLSLSVASASNLDTTQCATGTPGRTDLGIVQPGTSAITSLDCHVTFGSTNDTAGLRVFQSDREGDALWGGESPGPLDAAFASGAGYRSVSFVAGVDESAYDLAVQPDHKILVSGRSWEGGDMEYAVARFNGDGTTDTAFGVNGQRRIDLGEHELGNSLLVLDDGSIIVGGMTETAGGTLHRTGLVKLTSGGSVDTTWGASGWRQHDLRVGSWEEVHDLLLQPDGKILATGRLGNGAATDDAYVARVLANGTLDAGFGAGGIRVIDIEGGKDDAQSLELLPDGSILSVGFARRSGPDKDDMLIVKLTPGGGFDGSFGGGDGIALIDGIAVDVWDKAFDADVRPDGRIVVAGATQVGGTDDQLFVAQLRADGSLDPTFGTCVKVFDNPGGGDDDGLGIAVLPNGSITVVGGALLPDTSSMSVWRLNANGTLDSSFSGDGVNSYAIGGSSAVRVMGSAIHADGSVTFTGETRGADYDLLLGRVDAVGIPDYAGGRWTSNSPLFGACLRAASTVTATWAVDADATCTASDGDPWKPIARTSGSAGAEIARVASGVATGAVDLRFGVHLASSQRPGGLIAPLTFEVVAPA